ncbi:uncharacterized protein LOC119549584 [Drosophila subpulchrella]|uniref:uncharacterized protein LOC119549584 n=1 Tax=Drosophila subpulchrella TaxID=1486046 RepID=UPI0018A1664B|nr:uncharacterized protein LOC119549584 [Drosophila subpulchrella]
MAWLVILLLCIGSSCSRFLDVANRSNSDLEERLLSLLQRLQVEEFYDTLLIYGKDCIFHPLSRRLDVSTVLVSSGSTELDWNFGSLTLILSCSPELEKMVTNRTLVKLQTNRRLVYLRRNDHPDSVCDIYRQREQYNIAMVKDDFGTSNAIYACRHFEDPIFAEVDLSDNTPIYIEQFENMLGKPIKTVADLLSPRSMLLPDEQNGDKRITGYVANLVNTFAQKVNATLKVDVLNTKSIVREILRRVQDGELDIGTTLETSLRTTLFETASYPYILTSYCLMVQEPAKLPYNLVYAVIVDRYILGIIFIVLCILSMLLIYSHKKSWKDLSLANIVLNDKSLRGLLGQSFPVPSNANKHLKLIVCIVCFASIMLTTMYEAYLQSYFTNPPTEAGIHSFQDIGKNQKQIAIPSIEVYGLISTNNSHFQEIQKENIIEFDNMPECYKLRDDFNLSYNYLVTGDRWSAYAEQQTIFKEPVFYFARDLCFSRLIFLSVPLRPYLPYRHLFEDHMMRQQEFGFVSYWRSHSFFEMVRLGLTPLKDLSHPLAYTPSLLIEDVSWILKIYLAAMMISVVCFLLEIGVNRWKYWRKSSN